jgi:hypothetical protein
MENTKILQPGSKVFCIDDSIPGKHLLQISLHFTTWIKKRAKPYTVRRIMVHNNKIGLLLEEIINPERDDVIIGQLIEPGFSITRFRLPNPDEELELEIEEPSFKPEELIGIGAW